MFRRRQRRTQPDGPYYKQRSWQVSAGFLAVVLVVGGGVALTSGSHEVSDSGAQGSGPLGSTSADRGSRPTGCHTDDSAGSALPTAAPTDISWRTLDVARVPVSASAGPTRTSGAVWWCFAHTPTGAALAAHIIPAQMSGPNWRAVTEEQVVAGRGRDLFVSQRSTVRDAATRGASSPATYAGFAISSYRGSTADVELLMKTSSGYAATTIGLRWSGGDWKVVPSADGDLHTPVQTVPGANGFLMWGV
ncbi:hypothetical protein [Streptomyces hyaluromycini]|uniref:hypothetical protein n=1 Tax=Streptomyces hyaluromycini TaxID=1377993 RepID=UPI000B5C67F8|nr:hypothetical protein [Streptomyces hyaluromycini]